MKVKEIMTSKQLKMCRPKTPLHKAAKSMKSGNCGALPVVNKKKEVIGIVTDRDICLALAKKSLSPRKTTVKEIMPEKVHTIGQEEELSVALQQMSTRQVGRLPVTDTKGKLKGMVSLHDVIGSSDQNGTARSNHNGTENEHLLKTLHAVSRRYKGIKPAKHKKKNGSPKAHKDRAPK